MYIYIYVKICKYSIKKIRSISLKPKNKGKYPKKLLFCYENMLEKLWNFRDF